MPEGEIPSEDGRYTELTQADIARRLSDIKNSGGLWEPSAIDHPHFTLAGQQSKFAVARVDGRWMEPNGRYAYTIS